MKRSVLAAAAVLLSLCLAAPAQARRSQASHTDTSDWSEEHSARPSRSRQEARNFWDDFTEPAARPARAGRRHRETSNGDEALSRSARASRRHRETSDDDGSSSERHSVGGRPSAWCGWYMRTQHGGGPEYNLAANWRHWGSHSSGPQVGAIVVWPHHVGEITGQAANGQWIVKSGNDSGRVRERARSVSGAVFRVG